MISINILCLNHTLSEKVLTILREEKDFKIIDNLESFSQIEDIYPGQKIDIALAKVEDQQDLRDIENLIRKKNVRNVVAVGNGDGEIIFECIKAGIRGFLSHDIYTKLLKRAIRVIHKGEIWFDRKTSLKMFEEFTKHTAAKGQPELIESLSKREKEVLHLISQGYKNRNIAENLRISEKTVKNHLSHVYEKLGVEDRVNAIIFARKMK